MHELVDISGMTLAQIRDLFRDGGEADQEMLDRLQGDPRLGAVKLGASLRRARDERLKREARLRHLLAPENDLRRQGARAIAGLDEVGRGPLAGPVVSAAVILPWPCRWLGLDDSKRLTRKQRQAFARHIWANAIAVGQGIVSVSHIDARGILQATWESMRRALANLSLQPDHLLVDGPHSIPGVSTAQTPLVGGDARSLSVAAASVVAKVTRDEIMRGLDKKYPQYGFVHHKGYGTPEHLARLRQYGPCPIHRRTFRGVRDRAG
jgi:ribonuclease HII